MSSDCLSRVLINLEKLLVILRLLDACAGVIDLVYGRDAVLEAESQAQMLQGRKDLVDNSHVSPKFRWTICLCSSSGSRRLFLSI